MDNREEDTDSKEDTAVTAVWVDLTMIVFSLLSLHLLWV